MDVGGCGNNQIDGIGGSIGRPYNSGIGGARRGASDGSQ
jgi:hypothetical protein